MKDFEAKKKPMEVVDASSYGLDLAPRLTVVSVEDPPGARGGTMGVMHLCYFLDPDGHKICGIHRPA